MEWYVRIITYLHMSSVPIPRISLLYILINLKDFKPDNPKFSEIHAKVCLFSYCEEPFKGPTLRFFFNILT